MPFVVLFNFETGKYVVFKFLFLSVSLLTYAAYAEDQKLYVKLTSNDVIVGQLIEKNFKLESDFGALNVGADKVRLIDFKSKPKIYFMNDDILEARVLAKDISVNCEFGKLIIPLSKIKKISRSVIAEEENNLQWSSVKDGLKLGIGIIEKDFSNKHRKMIKVRGVLLNVSGKEKVIKYPRFFDRIKNTEEAIQKMYTVHLFASFRSRAEILEEANQEVMEEGLYLHPGAKIVFDFEIKIEDDEMALTEILIDESDQIPRDVKSKLHFKQYFENFYPKEGKNSFQLSVQFGDQAGKQIDSPELIWEYKP